MTILTHFFAFLGGATVGAFCLAIFMGGRDDGGDGEGK